MPRTYPNNVRDKSQADGPQVISLGMGAGCLNHQVQFTPSADPSAGTLHVDIVTPGASDFVNIGSIDMTDSSEYVMMFSGFAESVRVRPVGFDTEKTYTVSVCSGAGQ